MRLGIKGFLIGLLVGAVVTFVLKQYSKEVIKVPFEVEVEVPVVKHTFDTVYYPKPVPYKVKEIDTTLLEEYKKANDSLQEELFKSTVERKEYKEVFDDSIQTITVGADVTGKLNNLSVAYEQKPRKVKLDTTINVKIPKRIGLIFYIEAGMPKIINELNRPVLKVGGDLITKKNIVIGLSYDTNRTTWGKIGIIL